MTVRPPVAPCHWRIQLLSTAYRHSRVSVANVIMSSSRKTAQRWRWSCKLNKSQTLIVSRHWLHKLTCQVREETSRSFISHRGVATGVYRYYIPPKSVTVLFTCGTLTYVLKLQWLVKTYSPQIKFLATIVITQLTNRQTDRTKSLHSNRNNNN